MSRIFAATALVVAVVVMFSSGIAAIGRGATAQAAETESQYYLALGGSDSLGFQPTVDVPHGAPTDEGYADDLMGTERDRWPDLRLVQLGCPGETTLAMLSGGDKCHALASQLSLAVSFLQHHPSTVLVTVDVGFNDMLHCLGHHEVDEPCVELALSNLRTQLPRILTALRRAGGPALDIVGVDHYDPYLAAYLGGPSAKAFAEQSLDVISRLNDAMRASYAAAGIRMADVGAAFDMENSDPSALPDGELVPLDVARTCALTWACMPGPLGHNKHPNANGYQVITKSITDEISNP